MTINEELEKEYKTDEVRKEDDIYSILTAKDPVRTTVDPVRRTVDKKILNQTRQEGDAEGRSCRCRGLSPEFTAHRWR